MGNGDRDDDCDKIDGGGNWVMLHHFGFNSTWDENE